MASGLQDSTLRVSSSNADMYIVYNFLMADACGPTVLQPPIANDPTPFPKGAPPMTFRAFLLDESADMVERGLILAAIVVAAISLWNTLGSKLAQKLSTVNAAVQ